MKKITIGILSMLLICANLFCLAQKDTTQTSFKPKGKAIITIFGDFHSEFTETKNTGFSIERAYLGYQYQFTQELSAKVVLDMGKSSDIDDLQKLAYLKNAYITWQKGKFKLHAGLTGMEQFNTQEKAWGHRYLYKSLQDEYKFGNSADLGIVANYEFTSWFKADFSFVNGDGYKKLNLDPYFNYGLGLTFKPIKELSLRIYGSYLDKDATLIGQENLACFVGYKNKTIGIGAEYAAMWNYKGEEGKHQQGISTFININLQKNFDLFARCDHIFSTNNWNINKDETAIILGFEYTPNKHFRISPNFRMEIPKLEGKQISLLGFLNMEVKL